jgi:putative spermidine/putrescine transport system substrate-binding protein
MKTRRSTLSTIMFALFVCAIALQGCAPAATATPAPTSVPATVAPADTAVPATEVPTGPGPVATANLLSRDALVRSEGKIVTYGMPDYWAGFGLSWTALTAQFGITHEDTDMSSAEAIQRFVAEKANPIGDMSDVGISWGPTAISEGVAAAYKNPWWDEIPDELKDPDGYWCASYYGATAFVVRTDMVANVPHSFADLLKPEYKNQIAIYDPRQTAVGLYAVLAAAFANGGDETNMQPGVDFYAKLQKLGNLSKVDASPANLQSGEAPIEIIWDYTALADRDTLAADNVNVEVVIPSDGAAAGVYVALINAYAPHPNASRAFIDYTFSDQGQLDRAKGYAHPIRNITIPADVAAKLVPQDEYVSVRFIKDYAAFDAQSTMVKDIWGTAVIGQ